MHSSQSSFHLAVKYTECKPFDLIQDGIIPPIKQQSRLKCVHSMSNKAIPQYTDKAFWMRYVVSYSV